MKILVITGSFWPDKAGGVSKSVFAEVEALTRRGHRIIVVARRIKKNLPAKEVRNDYEVYRYPSPSEGTILYRLYPLSSLWYAPRLVGKLYGAFQPDVILVHQNPFAAVGLAQLAHPVAHVPNIYVFHSPIPREIEIELERGKYGLFTPVAKVVKHWIKTKERQALTHAHLVITRSSFMMHEMEKLHGHVGKDKTICIPLGVNTDMFPFVGNPRKVRRELNLPESGFILLSVRRLVARMGLENLITAMRRIKEEIPKALLLIGGEGYLKDYLQTLVQQLKLGKNVRFLGFIPEEMLSKYYQAADLFVLPTTQLEGFGLSTLEALSCGTPVIATPVGANPEVLGPLGKEFLTRDTTPEALAERIIYFARQGNSPHIRKMCREYCENNFSIEHVVNLLEQKITEVYNKSKSRTK